MGAPMSRYQLCRIAATVLILAPGGAGAAAAQAATGSAGTQAATGAAEARTVAGTQAGGLAGTETVESAVARTAAEPAYHAPRTPDGQPDISGIWTNDTLTPLERPAEDRKSVV